MKRSSTKREEIYANHEPTNDWYIECGRKFSTSAEKKESNPITELTKDMSRHFIEEGVQMRNPRRHVHHHYKIKIKSTVRHKSSSIFILVEPYVCSTYVVCLICRN